MNIPLDKKNTIQMDEQVRIQSDEKSQTQIDEKIWIQLDDGIQFGLGFFETICLRDGQPEFLDWHLERINHSLDTFGISQRVTIEEAENWIQNVLPVEGKSGLNAMKIMVSERNKHILLRHNPYTSEVLAKGFRLDYSPVKRNETSPLIYHKSMNYGDNILEKRRTGRLPIDEVVFLNTRGEISEGSTTNIFFAREGKLFTPEVSCGLLPGVMRRYVLEKFSVEETILYPADAEEMEECFVTNSLMGIISVTNLGDKQFRSTKIAEKIRGALW